MVKQTQLEKQLTINTQNENHAQTHNSQPYPQIIQVIWAIVYRLKRHIKLRFTFTMVMESSSLIWLVWLRRKCEKVKENFILVLVICIYILVNFILLLVICIYILVRRKFYRVIFYPQQILNNKLLLTSKKMILMVDLN